MSVEFSVLIFTEPILVLFAFYAALIYGLLYSFFFAFPVIYEPYDFSEGIESLMFIVSSRMFDLTFAKTITILNVRGASRS